MRRTEVVAIAFGEKLHTCRSTSAVYATTRVRKRAGPNAELALWYLSKPPRLVFPGRDPVGRRGFGWTDESDEYVRRHYNRGKSAAEIAKDITGLFARCTKNQVIRRAGVLGLRADRVAGRSYMRRSTERADAAK